MKISRFLFVAGLCAATACAEKEEVEEVGEAAEAAAAAPAAAGAPVVLTVDGTGLLERAKVTDEAARATALARVGGGAIVGAELEEEDGAFVYSYDVQVAGREGIEEVQVDAVTGQVVLVEHEDPSDESDESEEAEDAEESGR